MTVRSYLYVSQCLIDAVELDREVQRLVTVAEQYNRAHDITGALVCTGGRFAQIIEGNDSAVDTVLGKIQADPRHTDIVTLQDTLTERRRFKTWSLAYLGPSIYVQRSISLPLAQARRGLKPATEKLVTIIEEFALQQ